MGVVLKIDHQNGTINAAIFEFRYCRFNLSVCNIELKVRQKYNNDYKIFKKGINIPKNLNNN